MAWNFFLILSYTSSRNTGFSNFSVKVIVGTSPRILNTPDTPQPNVHCMIEDFRLKLWFLSWPMSNIRLYIVFMYIFTWKLNSLPYPKGDGKMLTKPNIIIIMNERHLKNKPLVEAILEIRWALQGKPNMQTDPHYKILLGRLFDRLSSAYSKHNPLPTASMPDEMAGYMVQHQFRVRENNWPLVQVGPGIITLNDTSAYTWNDFAARSKQVVDDLFTAYPDRDSLRINSMMLRYINAIEFDYEKEDLVEFLSDKMNIASGLPETLFADNKVSKIPLGLNWQSIYPIKDPKGVIQLKYATGKKAEANALIFEVSVQTAGKDVPLMPHGFEDWEGKAHEIIEAWFFKLIEGDLEGRFA